MNTKTPQIRFKGFCEDFEEATLSELVAFYKGKGFSKSDLTNAGNPIILYGQLYKNYQSFMTKVDSFVAAQDLSSFIVSAGDEVILPSSGESRSEIARASAVLQKNVILGADLNVLKPIKKTTASFLALTLTYGAINQEIVKQAQGDTVVHLYNRNLAALSLKFPSLKEQTKIGDLFQKLDRLIEFSKTQLEQTQLFKKAMLQRMFPQNGERAPRIRFKGFCEDWESKKLGDLASIVRGASPRPIEDKKWFDSDSEIGWLRISDVTKQDGKIKYLEQRLSKSGQEKTRVLNESHLLLSIAASVGKPVINYVKTGVHDGFLIFQKPTFKIEFMFNLLDFIKPNWSKYGQPGSQVNLNSDLVKNQEVMIPTLKEQTQIGKFFQSLDQKIQSQQTQFNQYQELKKALLQKMLI